GQVLTAGKSGNTDRGFAAVVAFKPAATHPVRLRVTVTSTGDGPASVDLDYAAVLASRDYGIVATTTWKGNLPAHLQGLPAGYRKAARLTVRNGSIVQGDGRSAAAAAVFAHGLNGLTMEALTTCVNGVNAANLFAPYAGDVTVRGCTFRSGVDNL